MSPYKSYLNLFLFFFAALFVSCSGEEGKTYVIGVSQCSEDVWRDKLNDELRLAATYYNNVDLRISSAYDDINLQTQQIDKFVEDDIDLLIVAPGQVSISPAIDRAFDKHIPVILFDRRTKSAKYTAYIGADNREIGNSMANYLAASNPGKLRIIEMCGLQTSSPAIERREGFDSVAATHPNLSIVGTLHVDWTEQGAFRAMDSLLASGSCPKFDCIFAHNDRMAMGARKAVSKHGMDVSKIKFCGVDAMPNGGMQLVSDGTLYASFIYPTRGDEVMQLAMAILTGKKYDRDNLLSAALVNEDNAKVLLMQNDETARQQDKLTTLRGRVDQTAHDYKKQRIYLCIFITLSLMLIIACVLIIKAYHTKSIYNRQLKEMNRQIEQITHTRLQFFTNISHELRTPLTLIAGPTEQLLQNRTLSREQRKTLEMVLRNTKILIGLVGQILNFRKVQNDKEKLTLNRFALKDDIALWAEDFRTTAQLRKVDIRMDLNGIADGSLIIADREKMSHIFFNLMANAMKYTPAGGTITITLKQDADWCSLAMNNTGSNINTEELPHIFDRFYQAKGTVGGTGIGLALVKAYVDLHHGSLAVESDEVKGVTFIITLPVSQPGYDEKADKGGNVIMDTTLYDDSYLPVDNEAEKAAMITDAEEFDDDKPLVLVIDDNSGMRAYLHSILQEKYNVIEAADGKSGLERAQREVPKLIVSDVMMPVMDGLEFTRQLKNDTATSHIPVILLTARTMNEQREEGYETGADSYITKPFSGNVLMARINNLLKSRKLLRNIFCSNPEEAKEDEQHLCPKDRSFIERLRKVIRENLGDSDFSVERIGEEIGLSRVQLYRKVKALTGQTPVELLRKARLEKARHMLQTQDKSISEIAYECGFTSPSYFNKCFKDEYSTTPSSAK